MSEIKLEYVDDVNKVSEVLDKVDKNDGYCPCMIVKNENTICPCKGMRTRGKCICGLYKEVSE